MRYANPREERIIKESHSLGCLDVKDHEEEGGIHVGELGNDGGLWNSFKILSVRGFAGLHEGLMQI